MTGRDLCDHCDGSGYEEDDTSMDDMLNFFDQGGRYDKDGNPIIDRSEGKYFHYVADDDEDKKVCEECGGDGIQW